MRVDLHNHTTLCNHATGTVEEYIQRAIELGIDEYGFSDHAPMNYDPKYRMDISQRNLYEKWVLEVKEKYKNQIKVLLAYEVDYLEGYLLDEILNAKVDYLIGSVHFLKNKSDMWGFDNPEFIGAMLVGLNRKASAEFSFLLAFPVMCATTGYDLLKHHNELLNDSNFLNLAVGFVVSFIIAFLAIKLFLKFLENFTFVAFGIYRIVFGILLLIIF